MIKRDAIAADWKAGMNKLVICKKYHIAPSSIYYYVGGLKRSHHKTPKQYREQYKDILDDWQALIPTTEIVKKHQITKQRIHQIATMAKIKRPRVYIKSSTVIRDRNTQIRQDYTNGLPMDQIQQKYSLKQSTIYIIVRQTEPLRPRKSPNLERNLKIINDYINGLTINQLAKKYKLSIGRINQFVIMVPRFGKTIKVTSKFFNIIDMKEKGIKSIEIVRFLGISRSTVDTVYGSYSLYKELQNGTL